MHSKRSDTFPKSTEFADEIQYPRPPWFKLLRSAIRLWWLAFAVYPGNVVFNLYGLIAHGGLSALLDFHELQQALLIDRLLLILNQQPAVVIPCILVVSTCVLAGRWAHSDIQKEKDVLAARVRKQQEDDFMEEVNASAVAAGQSAAANYLSTLVSPTSLDARPQFVKPFDNGLLIRAPNFVGRAEEREWLIETLRAGHTTVAVYGMGGIGKTVLVAEVVHELRQEGRFPSGIVVVVCGGQSDAIQVLRQILARFYSSHKLPDTRDLGALAAIARDIATHGESLVVLDHVNPEFRLDDVIVPLQTAGMTVVLTSRHEITSQSVLFENRRRLNALTSTESSALFQLTLHRGGQDSGVTPDIDRIVTALGFHPLAIRLAASYATDAQLDLNSFAYDLEMNPRRALDIPDEDGRHYLRLIFDQSHKSLTANARALFASLAAFRSTNVGWEATLAVGTASIKNPSGQDSSKALLVIPDPEAERALALLSRRALIDIVTNVDMPSGADGKRVHIHPLIHTFANELFDRRQDVERSRAFRGAGAFYADYSRGHDLDAISLDATNILGIMQWAYARELDHDVVALCNGMCQYFETRIPAPEAVMYIRWALGAIERTRMLTLANADTLRAARILICYGHCLDILHDGLAAERYLLAALVIVRMFNDHDNECRALLWLGHSVKSISTEQAENYYQMLLDLSRAKSVPGWESAALGSLGQMAVRKGALDIAKRYFDEELEVLSREDNPHNKAIAFDELGDIAELQGNLSDAERYFERSLGCWLEEQDWGSAARLSNNLARLAEIQGRPSDAEGYRQQSLDYYRKVGIL